MESVKEPLYSVRVEDTTNRMQLLQIVGTRQTVLDAALRVCLDSTPVWNAKGWTSPMFGIHVQKIP